MHEVVIIEGSTPRGAGLYDVDQVRYGLIRAGGDAVWRPSGDTTQWATLMGPDATAWVFSGALGEEAADGTAVEPVVWPGSAGDPGDVIPTGIDVRRLAEYQVLLAPRRGDFVALGVYPDGGNHLWGVVGSRTVLDEELGDGFPQWTQSAGGSGGALTLSGAVSSAIRVHWNGDTWTIDRARVDGRAVGAQPVDPSHLLVSTLTEEDGCTHWLLPSDGPAVRVPTDLPVIGGAVVEQGHLVLAANSVATDTGKQTHLAFHPAPDQLATWRATVPGELFLAPGRGGAVATLYSSTRVLCFDVAGRVVSRVDSDPEPRGVGPGGTLIHVGEAGLEPMA